MNPENIQKAQSSGNQRIECKYELLVSETRPPNLVHASPQHTITLARSRSADRIYLRNEETLKATELAIRDGTLKFVELGPDVLAIELIDHALGWPYSESATSQMYFRDFAQIDQANRHVPFYRHDLYDTESFDGGVSVLDIGCLKTVHSLRFERDKATRKLSEGESW